MVGIVDLLVMLVMVTVLSVLELLMSMYVSIQYSYTVYSLSIQFSAYSTVLVYSPVL